MAAMQAAQMMISGPDQGEHTALLIPGGFCTAAFYADLMDQPALAGIRLVAVTLPGHGGVPAPPDVSIEHLARMVAELAAEVGCDVVVGHSLGATVALEMAASAAFDGPIVLLTPAFSRRGESMIIRVADRLAAVLDRLPYVAMRSLLPRLVKDCPLPADRRAVLTAELARNDPAAMKRVVHEYLRYLDRHGSVAGRLANAGNPAWVVHGESGDGGLTFDERWLLQSEPAVRLVTIPGPSVLTANENPELVADLVLEALRVATPAS